MDCHAGIVGGQHPSTTRQGELDAVLTFAVATGCAVAFVAFVAGPVHVRTLDIPLALEGIWQVGMLVGAFLGPVAAGVAAYISACSLYARAPGLTPGARRLHYSTIGVSLGLLVAYVANAGALRVWLD